MGSDYQFLTVWRVAGTVEEVKAVLNDGKALPDWWPSVYLDVREVEPGQPDGLGRVLDLHTKGWLPYTLRWTLRITEPVTDAGFALEASGNQARGAGRSSRTGPKSSSPTTGASRLPSRSCAV